MGTAMENGDITKQAIEVMFQLRKKPLHPDLTLTESQWQGMITQNI